jgi:hypothetical protein
VITQSTVLPLIERQARTRARWLRAFRFVLGVCAVLAPITLALALWLATRTELGPAVTLLCLDVLLWVAAYVRLTDVGPKDAPR